MATLRNRLSLFFLFLFSLSFSLQAQQHPFFGRNGKPVKTSKSSKSFMNARVTGTTGTDSVGFGGEPGVVWERMIKEVFPEFNEIYLTDIIRLADGSFAISGIREDSASRSFPFIIKVDDQGKVIWKNWLTKYNNWGQYPEMLATKDSGLILGGVLSPDLGQGFLVSKLDKNGKELWQTLDNDSRNTPSMSCRIILGINGGYVLTGGSSAGRTNDSCTFQRDTFNIALIKIDDVGNVEWKKKQFIGLLPAGQLGDISVKALNDGYIVGTTHIKDNSQCLDNLDNSLDFLLEKLDVNGNLIWKKEYGGKRYEYMSGLIKVSDKEVLIFGETNSIDGDLLNVNTDSTSSHSWLISVNDTGKILLNHVYNLSGKHDNSFYSGFKSNDSTYILAGAEVIFDTLNGNYGYSGYLMNIKKDGDVLWKAVYSGKAIFGIIPSIKEEILYIAYLPFADGQVFGKLGQTSNITGSVYYDFNKNNSKDSNEPYASRFLITSEKTGYSRSSVATNGWFRNDVDTGTYKTTVKLTNDYYVTVPAEKQTTFTSLFQNDTVHFALQPVAGKRDVSISLIPVTPARPGFNAKYKLTFRNNGTDTIPNGGVILIKDARVTLVSSIPAVGLVTGDSLLWSFGAFKPFDEYTINIELKLAAPPTVNNGDTLRYAAAIVPATGIGTDLTPLDDTARLAQVVVGSYDPNDKQENVAGKIPLAKVAIGEDIQYLIRFQNTGTDTAFTVRITDTLDAKLNWNSLQMIGSGHSYKMTVVDGNKISWAFPNINLPDSNVNEPLSHGYIAFRIKAKNNLTAGEYFQNKASIYFDYNLPVETNRTTTVVSSAIITNVRNLSNDDIQLLVLPNPTSGNFYLKLNGRLSGKFECSIIDLYGRVIQTQVIERGNGQDVQLIPLQLERVSAGVYHVILRQKNNMWQQRIIVQ